MFLTLYTVFPHMWPKASRSRLLYSTVDTVVLLLEQILEQNISESLVVLGEKWSNTFEHLKAAFKKSKALINSLHFDQILCLLWQRSFCFWFAIAWFRSENLKQSHGVSQIFIGFVVNWLWKPPPLNVNWFDSIWTELSFPLCVTVPSRLIFHTCVFSTHLFLLDTANGNKLIFDRFPKGTVAPVMVASGCLYLSCQS